MIHHHQQELSLYADDLALQASRRLCNGLDRQFRLSAAVLAHAAEDAPGGRWVHGEDGALVKRKQPNAEELLGIHLGELGLGFARQWQFCEGRKWLADFYLARFLLHGCGILIEVDGFFKGRHGAGWGKDYERDRMAAKLGYFTLRFSTKEVLNGSAKEWIAQHLLGKAE